MANTYLPIYDFDKFVNHNRREIKREFKRLPLKLIMRGTGLSQQIITRMRKGEYDKDLKVSHISRALKFIRERHNFL